MSQKIRRCLLTVRGWQWVAVGLLSVALAGCDSARTGDPNDVKVSGTVTFDGKPLPSATGVIMFRTSSGGTAGAGPIDADGHYTVSLPPGTYQVAVSCTAAPTMSSMPTGGPGEPGSDPPAPGSPLPGTPSLESVIPAKYSNPETSGLTATIDKAQSGLDFALTP